MLNHVSKWDTVHGRVHTTAAQAHKDYPYGLTYHSTQFLCETCGQYVTLRISHKGKPFFWHPVGSNDCDDKLTSYTLYRKANPLGFSLPLRIHVSQSTIEVFIGFLPLSLLEMDRAEANDIILQIVTRSGKTICNYAITSERFSCDHITYLSVGEIISEHYRLNCDGGNKYYWPLVVDGISSKGTLFDCSSGKRLPRNANVFVGRQYWLLIQKSLSYHTDIHISLEKKWGAWNLYRVNASMLSRGADNFFLKYGARLTTNPSEITHIWPPAICSSHFLTHCADKVWLYKTEGFIASYPIRRTYEYGNGFFFVSKSSVEQILALSRFENCTSVLKYTLVRYTPQMLRRESKLQSIYITDINDASIESGEYTSLPSKQVLIIKSKFDGFARVKQKGYELERISFKGNEQTVVDVKFNQVLSIFQGLDCVAEISFIRETISNRDNDNEFVLSLSRCSGYTVKAPHTIGALANQMQDMPMTKRWLRDQLRTGNIKVDAVKMLVKRFGRI